MGNLLLIYRKEMRSYFLLPIGSVLMVSAAVLFGLVAYATHNDSVREQLAGPIFSLTWFQPPAELRDQPVLLAVGFARVMALILIPLIAMRLFPEERQMRTMEMLLTSPVTELDIVLGKWLGALSLLLLVMGVSLLELAVFSPWLRLDWSTVLITYSALGVFSGGLLSAGEGASVATRHQGAAAAVSLLWCEAAFRFWRTGVLHPAGTAVLLVMTAAGWVFTLRSIRALRNAF